MSKREHLFGFADSRGNNPHGTRETSQHEDHRLNAKRYETVGQIERELDVRARSGNRGARMPGLMRRTVGDVGPVGTGGPVAPKAGPSFLETLFIFAAGAGIMYLLTRDDKDDENDEDGDGVRTSRVPWPASAYQQNPAPAAAPVTVVLPAQAQPSAPVVVVPSSAEKPARKRRSRAKTVVAAPVVVTVEPPAP